LFSRPYISCASQGKEKQIYVCDNPQSVYKTIKMPKYIRDSFPFLGCVKYHMPPCEKKLVFFLLINKMCKTLIGKKLDFGYASLNQLIYQKNVDYTQS